MKQKEKEKLINKKKTAKNIVLSVVFLFSILVIFSFNTSFSLGSFFRGEGFFMTSHAIVNPFSASSVGDALLWTFNMLLYAVFKLMGALVMIAANIFDWVVKVENFKMVMNMSSIETGWRMVRDFLNLFFILILLFSAFCTIFQVEKYNIKKILLTLVIMALLVNFSFPISRVVIDAGNIPMYYFFQAISGNNGGSISKILWNDSNGNVGLQEFVLPGTENLMDTSSKSSQTFSLIAAIIFVFIFGITLLVLAILFVIRMLVLALLVIFSPVGFVAAIFPGFSKYSSDWWEQLFKQSFFGTVMAFMLYLSLLIMKTSQQSFAKSMANSAATGKDTVFSSIIVGGVTLAIPIALLWIGMIAAQKMGAAGAGAVVGKATKFAKWAGRLPWRGAKGMAVATGVPGGLKQAADYYKKKGAPGVFGKIPGLRGSDKREDTESRVANKITGGRAGLSSDGLERKKVADRVEEMKKISMGESEAKSILQDKKQSSVYRKAAANYLNSFEKINDYDSYKAAMEVFNGDDESQKKITRQVKKDSNIHLIIRHDVDVNGKAEQEAVEDNLNEMNAKDIAKQKELHKILNSSDPALSGIKNGLDSYFFNLKNSLDHNDNVRFKKVIQNMDKSSYTEMKKAGLT